MSLVRLLLMLTSLACLVLTPYSAPSLLAQGTPQAPYKLYLPTVLRSVPSPFGAETFSGSLANAAIGAQMQQLGARWIRMNAIYWRFIQPERGGPYNVSALAKLDKDLAFIQAAQLTPIIAVQGSPSWATINRPVPTACGAIRTDRFADFAAFMGWLAARYKDRVQYWELGNEPDIDPAFVAVDQVFGCWGDTNDPYYGGGHYGNMLKAVVPAIRRANPNAKIVIGGLVLPTPKTTDPNLGKPENFFEGVLRSGAQDSFDIVAFHSYPDYTNRPLDYDYDADTLGPWQSLGGFTLGKAAFLRTLMAKYGIANKPLFLNETAMTCLTPPEGNCPGLSPVFYRAQANFLVRMLTRGWSVGIQQFSWYTLEWPGFRHGSLLDENLRPRLVYTAYQTFIAQTSPSDRPVRIYDYDRDDVSVETYRFDKGPTLVDVLWGKDLSTYYVKVPPGFINAYDQYGVELTPIGPYLPVSFGAIYIEHRR